MRFLAQWKTAGQQRVGGVLDQSGAREVEMLTMPEESVMIRI